MDNKLFKQHTEQIGNYFKKNLLPFQDELSESLIINDKKNIKFLNNPLIKSDFNLNVYDRVNMKSKVLCLKFHHEENKIICGLNNGQLITYNLETLGMDNLINSSVEKQPVTCIRWGKVVKDSIICSNTDGNLSIYNNKTGKIIGNYLDKKKQFLCFDTDSEDNIITYGDEFGNIGCIDTVTFKQINFYKPYCQGNLGHNNRVNCIKLIDENLFLSGGWDANLIFWDRRKPKAINKIFGPKISGEAIDVLDDKILIGNYKYQDGISPLEIYDLRKLKRNDNDIFYSNEFVKQNKLYKNCYSFCKFLDKNTIIGGGSQPTFVNILEKNEDQFEVKWCIKGIYKSVLCGDFNHDKSMISFGTGDEILNNIKIKNII